jgi:hypothetical protein
MRLPGKLKHFSLGADSDMEVAQNAALKTALLLSGYDLPHGAHERIALEVEPKTVDKANSILNTWHTEAEQLVSRSWLKIESVASLLLTADLISEAELDHLIAA